MKIALIVCGSIAAVIFLFWLITHRVNRTPLEVADTIEAFLDGTLDWRRWDDFICLRIKDDKLNEICMRCNDVSLDYPSGEGESYCNEQGRELMRSFVKELRG